VGVLRSFAAAAVATFVLFVVAAQAGADAPDDHSFLLFGGTDLWRDGAFFYGGTLWSPAGRFEAEGFTLKLLLSGGGYTYPSGGLHTEVDGTLVSAAVLPGWRATRDGVSVGFYAGPAVQDYRLTPNDPGSRLRGLYGGAEFDGNIWFQLSPTMMATANGSIVSIGPTGSVRAAVGWRLFEPFYVGPEAQGIWCAEYQQLRLGAHVTGFRIEGVEWSAASGWAIESDGRSGPYVRLGFNARY